MTEKKTRLLFEDDVIKIIDKHTRTDGTLDDDISCILEEVKDVTLIGSKKSIENLQNVSEQNKIPSMKLEEMKIMPYTESTITVPRVFIFNSNLSVRDSVDAQKAFRQQIEQGCLVLPGNIDFIGVEEPLVIMS